MKKAAKPIELSLIPEPNLEFRYGQRLHNPHDGLALFGPVDADDPSRPGSITYITLGPSEGLDAFGAWTGSMAKPAVDSPDLSERLWPPFPGFEAAFNSDWPHRAAWSFYIDRGELIRSTKISDPYERAVRVVDMYLEGLRRAAKLDEHIGVGICVVPDEVYLNCRPQSRVVNPTGEVRSKARIKSRKKRQKELFDDYDPLQYELSPDFRRQLKARCMEFGFPLQIVRESTLRLSSENRFGERGLTPLSDRMWNLSTTLYYKCGGKPWRLVTPRDGVCYIGIAFRRSDPDRSQQTACCAAQMFLDSGDGVVFLGEFGPWYSPTTREFHLSRDAAQKLLAGVLQTYQDLGGKKLEEVFLHSRSSIDEEEFQGYADACPNGVRLVGVRVRADRLGPRLYGPTSMPVLRGTFWKVTERTGFLLGSGFKPRLATFDGWEVPVPLRIDIQHGESDIERVAEDILGLTKLNYNACRLGDSEPVTVGFSDAVGEILVANPTIQTRRPQFKFYI